MPPSFLFIHFINFSFLCVCAKEKRLNHFRNSFLTVPLCSCPSPFRCNPPFLLRFPFLPLPLLPLFHFSVSSPFFSPPSLFPSVIFSLPFPPLLTSLSTSPSLYYLSPLSSSLFPSPSSPLPLSFPFIVLPFICFSLTLFSPLLLLPLRSPASFPLCFLTYSF